MVKIDLKDQTIVKCLHTHGRLTIAQISRKTKIQRDSVMYRIRRMEEQGVIRFFHPVLNPQVLGYPVYSYVAFTLHNVKISREKEFIGFLQEHPQIVYVAKTVGKWHMVINIAAKSLREFDSILSLIRTQFVDIVKNVETSSIIEEYKYDDMVGLLSQ